MCFKSSSCEGFTRDDASGKCLLYPEFIFHPNPSGMSAPIWMDRAIWMRLRRKKFLIYMTAIHATFTPFAPFPNSFSLAWVAKWSSY